MSRVHSDVPWVSCSPSRTRGRSAWGVGPPASVPARSALDRPREQSGWGRSWPSTWDRSGSRLPTVTRDKKSQSLTEPCRLQDDLQSLFWPVRIKDWLTSNLKSNIFHLRFIIGSFLISQKIQFHPVRSFWCSLRCSPELCLNKSVCDITSSLKVNYLTAWKMKWKQELDFFFSEAENISFWPVKQTSAYVYTLFGEWWEQRRYLHIYK